MTEGVVDKNKAEHVDCKIVNENEKEVEDCH